MDLPVHMIDRISIDADGVISCEGEHLAFKEVDIYYPSEDWMRMQVDYTRFGGDGDNDTYGRRFGVGGIDFNQFTPNAFDVRSIAMDSSGEETVLFDWNDEYDLTPYDSDGDIEISAEFAYCLCLAIEENSENNVPQEL